MLSAAIIRDDAHYRVMCINGRETGGSEVRNGAQISWQCVPRRGSGERERTLSEHTRDDQKVFQRTS